MTSSVIKIYTILFSVNVFLDNNSIRAEKNQKNDENNAVNIVGAERLAFWDPKLKTSSGSRRSFGKKESELWFDMAMKSNQSDYKAHWHPRNRMGPVDYLRSATANISASVNVVPNDTKRSRFGHHHGQRVRSTRVAPMHLMQQEPEPDPPQDKKDKKKHHNVPIDDDDDPFLLSPYAIEEQFTKLFHCFDDVEFSTEVLGRTASYVNIILFKITKKGSSFFRARDSQFVENEPKEKKILFIVHALSPMGLTNLFTLTLESYLKKLLGYYLEHLDKFDIYLMPLANPDGYLKLKSKVWNKNVATNADCSGVNVDRNFDVGWNSTGRVSSCSQHYPGAVPFSEPESRAVRDVFHRISHKIAAYFHVHGGTYNMGTFKGDAVLYPKGYTDQQSDDDKYVDLRGEIDEAIKNANFKVMSVTVDTLYNWYGKVSGTSVDYAATVYGIPYAMELVMQVYIDAAKTEFDILVWKKYSEATAQEAALEEIWKRVINVIFTNIHNKIEGNDNK